MIRTIELTSYAEVVIASLNADLAHLAFSNLFVQTEILPDSQAILWHPASARRLEKTPWLFHLMTTQGQTTAVTCPDETDRLAHWSRLPCHGESWRRWMASSRCRIRPFGPVLDPVVAIRQAVLIASETSANWHVISGMAETREQALVLINVRYRDLQPCGPRLRDGLVAQPCHSAAIAGQRSRKWKCTVQLASSIIHANPPYRAGASVLTRNRFSTIGLVGLWDFRRPANSPACASVMPIESTHRQARFSRRLRLLALERADGGPGHPE